jgi:hypothetical protein
MRPSVQKAWGILTTFSQGVHYEETTFDRSICHGRIHYRVFWVWAARSQQSSGVRSTQGSAVDAIATESTEATTAEKPMAENAMAEG